MQMQKSISEHSVSNLEVGGLRQQKTTLAFKLANNRKLRLIFTQQVGKTLHALNFSISAVTFAQYKHTETWEITTQ